ncbi:MAG TPA: prepilin-type N-terminal cleavage/methylation domain-containing protein [Dehalococcoidia bacterium]|nr:prepilin-type N-terminal cleavage/methylation domain-containing protein [Dehalococcoidia bacterium]
MPKDVNKNQRGLTAIETLIAITIAGLVIAGITMTIIQLMNVNDSGVSHMTAMNQVQNTGYWISKDTLQAKCIDLGLDGGFPLVLAWTSPDTYDDHKVRYTLANHRLQRDIFVNDVPVGSTHIADDISSISLENELGKYTLTVTATTSGQQENSATRVYDIVPRVLGTGG